MFGFASKSRYKDFSDYITTLAYLAELNEWDNRPHLERIRKYTHLISSAAGISGDECEAISYAAQLHDIGKIATPPELLKKPGNYDEKEWPIIERHTSDGAAILSQTGSPLLLLGSSIALTHHERWDGSGYPNHLKGEQIPLAGRITALADVFDALTTPRAYKHMVSPREALELIRKSSQVLFDPALVRAFEQSFEEINKIQIASMK